MKQHVTQLTLGVFQVALACILFQTNSARADIVDYTFTYDPVSRLTTISNSPTSASAFDFYTFLGPLAGLDLQLPPGDEVTVDGFGNVTGDFLDPEKQICINKKETDVLITITDPDQSPIGIIFGDGHMISTTSSSIYISSSMLAGGFVASQNDFTMSYDAVITTTEPTMLGIDSSAFRFQDQVNYQIFYGSVESVDNTQTFSSIFDPEVMTGCVPEPSTWAMMLLGFAGLGWCGRRRRRTGYVGAPRRAGGPP